MLAMAFLAVTAADERDQNPTPPGLVPMSLNELRRLFDALSIAATATTETILKWSIWRRNTKLQPANATITAGQRTSNTIYCRARGIANSSSSSVNPAAPDSTRSRPSRVGSATADPG